MDDPADPATPTPSLAGRLRAAVRRKERPVPVPAVGSGRGVALAVVLLLAAAPAATWAGAVVLRQRVDDDRAMLEQQLAPSRAAARDRVAARDQLRTAFRTPGVAATLEAAASVLPPDAALVAAERDGSGNLRLDVATPDPDRLRAALRRDPDLAILREAGQRQGDAGMVVTFRSVEP